MSVFPFHDESERDYHSWVGLYITTWAGVELGLDTLMHTLYRFFHAQEIEAERPVALKRKIKLLRKCFSRNPEIRHEKDQVFSLSNFISEEAEFRHNLVHGLNRNIYKVSPYYAVMGRPVDKNNPFGPTTQTIVTEQDLRQRYDRVGYAVLCIIGLNSRLVEAIETRLRERISDS